MKTTLQNTIELGTICKNVHQITYLNHLGEVNVLPIGSKMEVVKKYENQKIVAVSNHKLFVLYTSELEVI